MALNYLDACDSPDLFGPWFSGPSWDTWRVVDKAVFGLPMSASELAVFKELSGRDEAPTAMASEFWAADGRRSGKTLKGASYVTFLAAFGPQLFGYEHDLQRGEIATCQLLAVDKNQAAVAFGFVKGFFRQPLLAELVERETADTLVLRNQMQIQVTTSNPRSLRGRAVPAAILDECAFYPNDVSDSPDEELFRALKPATAQFKHPLIMGLSSPYAKRGLLYQKYAKHFGQPGPVLVIQAPTEKLNPTVDPDFIKAEFESDPVSAACEFGAQFRDDVRSLISREQVMRCIEPGVRERPFDRRFTYLAFADMSGGRGDSAALGIGHKEGSTAVLDLLIERPAPHNPESVCAEFATEMKKYRISRAMADRYSGSWAVEAFRREGVYLDQSAPPKSQLYGDVLLMLVAEGVALLDDSVLVNQLVGLERRTGRGGHDVIDHGRFGRDDVCNAAAGVLTLANSSRRRERRHTDIRMESCATFHPHQGLFPRQPQRMY